MESEEKCNKRQKKEWNMRKRKLNKKVKLDTIVTIQT